MAIDPNGIGDLLASALGPTTGPEDWAAHTGTVASWDPTSMVNTVIVNGVLLSNLRALQSGIGLNYSAGDTVMVIRKQTQYFVLGKVAAPGTQGVVGSAPAYSVTSGGNLNGSPGSFRDLDVGGTSPTVTVRIGGSALLMFGANVETNNSKVEIGFTVSGSSTFAPAVFLGSTVFAGNNNLVNGGPTVVGCPSKSLMIFKGTGVGSSRFSPGIMTFGLKYNLTLYNNGTGAVIGAPWISVIPF